MDKKILSEILANGENSGVEFKRDEIGPEELAKECVAFANLKGGIVFLGVEDDGTVSGLKRTKENVERWIMDAVFGKKITPAIIPFYEEIHFDENLRIGVIHVEQGISKPYAVKRNDREDIYVRIGSVSRIATREQIIRLAQESGFHTEVLPVSGSALEDIDYTRFLSYIRFAYGETIDISDKNSIIKRLLQLDLITRHERFGIVATLAGMLLFGEDPKRFLNQSGFRLIGYEGDEPGYDTYDDQIIDAPIAEHWDESEKIIRYGLISLMITKLKRHLYSENLDEYGRRMGHWKYPFEVLRELIVNSIVHRDWTKANSNKIELFNDRFELTSFGSLPNTLTLEKILAGQQYPRNPILVRIVRDYKYMDDRGLGIRRKVIPILKEQGFPEPKFEASDDFVRVTVYSKR